MLISLRSGSENTEAAFGRSIINCISQSIIHTANMIDETAIEMLTIAVCSKIKTGIARSIVLESFWVVAVNVVSEMFI
jgi:hypothetical protein